MNTAGKVLLIVATFLTATSVLNGVIASRQYGQGWKSSGAETRDMAVGVLFVAALLVIAAVIWGGL